MKLPVMLLMAALPVAQEFGSLEPAPARTHHFVAYQAEQLVVPAGKRGVLELRFYVENGYHVNSHLPKSELQIATKVELAAESGVKISAAGYPAGKLYVPSFDPGEKLDVYSGQFTVSVPVVASAGAHELKGSLKYQACDRAACYPPKTLPLVVVFTAK